MTSVYIVPHCGPELPYSLVFWPNFRFEIPPRRLFLRDVMEQYQTPFFTIADTPGEANFFAVPFEYFFAQKECPAYLARVFASAKAVQKKVLLFDYTDYVDWTPPLPSHTVLFRVSAYRHHKRPNELIMPYFVEDLGSRYGIVPAQKKEEPSIGYCGQADFSGFNTHMRAVLKRFLSYAALTLRQDKEPAVHARGIFWRRKAISIIRQSGVPCDFVIRRFYSLHQKSGSFDAQEVRKAYVENLRACDLALCVRGDANASQRFYETLSAARIPLLLDTDCVLPLEERIDYGRVLLRVPWSTLNLLPAITRAYMENLPAQRIEQIEQEARAVYDKYLCMDRFFSIVFDRDGSPYKEVLYHSDV